jgi:hypothetical protein
VAALVLAVTVWNWLDDPESPPNPALDLALLAGNRVEACRRVAESEDGPVWICAFFQLSPSLREELAGNEPSDLAAAGRVACILGRRYPGDSDRPVALGYASPDELDLVDRCRKEIADLG